MEDLSEHDGVSWQPLERRLAGMTFFDIVALANQWRG